MPQPTKTYQFEKLHELLKPKEQKTFGQWLKGIVGKRHQAMLLMYQYWVAGKSWTQIANILKIPVDQATSRLNHLRGELQQKLETYFSWLALQQDEFLRGSLILMEINQRGGKNIFPLIAKKVEKKQNQSIMKDATYHRAAYMKATIEQSYLVKFPPRYRKKSDLLERRLLHWNFWARLEAYELGLHLLVRQQKDLVFLIEPFLRSSESLKGTIHELDVLAIVQMLYEMYRDQTWKKESNESVYLLVKNLEKHQSSFSTGTFSNLHILLFNFLLRKVHHFHDRKTYELLMDLYEWNARDRIWPISRRVYRTVNNLMAVIMQMIPSTSEKQVYMKQARRFLEEYRGLLPEDEAQNAYKLNLAHYYFSIGSYEEVLVQQLTSDNSDPYYAVGYQAIIMQARLELGDTETLPESIQTLKQRIRKTNSFSERQKLAYLNRLNLFLKLIRIKTPKDAQELFDLIKETQPLGGRAWLERKTQSLIQ